MNPSRRGLSTAAKAGAAVIVAVVVLAGAYFSPSLLGGAKTSTTLSNGPLTSLSLFGYFSHMEVKITQDSSQQALGSVQTQAVTYAVLGREQWNLTEYTKVEFSEPGAGGTVVAWFNSAGTIDRLDVLAEARNYTGPGAAIIAQIDTNALGLVTAVSNNATLVSMLSQSSQNTTTIGSVQLNATTYTLPAPTAGYKHITLEMVNLPGTSQRLAVYLDLKTISKLELTMWITNLAK